MLRILYFDDYFNICKWCTPLKHFRKNSCEYYISMIISIDVNDAHLWSLQWCEYFFQYYLYFRDADQTDALRCYLITIHMQSAFYITMFAQSRLNFVQFSNCLSVKQSFRRRKMDMGFVSRWYVHFRYFMSRFVADISISFRFQFISSPRISGESALLISLGNLQSSQEPDCKRWVKLWSLSGDHLDLKIDLLKSSATIC